MDVTFAGWAALVVGLAALLLLDLFVLHRGAHEVSLRDAAWSTAGFVAVGVGFGVGLWAAEGWSVASQFYAGYVLEEALSLDNVFVWALIFSAFAIPAAYQRRVLYWGIFGALVLRGGFVAAGSGLLEAFHWVVYAFGVLLLLSGVRMLRGSVPPDPERLRLVRFARARLPMTRDLAGARLVARAHDVAPDDRPAHAPLAGRWYVTPLLGVLVVIELTDIVFAVDSIPAIFGVTREPFLVFSATALALLGLRSMYFLLAGARHHFVYLDEALAAILAFVGLKFLLSDVVEIGPGVSLAVIVGTMSAAVGASLLSRRAPRAGRGPPAPAA